MAEGHATRRLAAILVADVVGYSRLMGDDEDGTLAALKERRKVVVEPLVRVHAGRIVKFMGDGVLVEFASAVNAVACALELQRRMAEMSEPVADARRILLRIGINLGEVVGEGADVFGDGVNIAARLEGLAEPGGICLSGKVVDEVTGKLEFTSDDLGEVPLKNILRPVRTHRISPAHSRFPLSNAGPKTSGQPITVAVLPLTNMTGDAAQDYFVDGISEDLITALAKARFLSVVSRNSTFQFKNRSVDVQTVGRQLGARFVLEGSVRIGNNRIRATAQLIETATGTHVWAERFDRELSDVFAVQDEIVEAIAAQLSYNLIDAAAGLRSNATTTNVTAYDHVLRGRAAWRRGAVKETLNHWLAAVEADSNYPAALASLAFLYAEDAWMQMLGRFSDDLVALAEQHIERAIAADDGDSYVQHMIGTALMSIGDLEKAKQHLELSITLNPHYPSSTMNLGLDLFFMGAHREGLALIEKAYPLEPRLPPAMQAVPFYAHCIAGDADAALADLGRIENPLAYWHLMMGACLSQANRNEDAKRQLAEFEKKRTPWFDVDVFVRRMLQCLRLEEDRKRVVDGFRKAGLIT